MPLLHLKVYLPAICETCGVMNSHERNVFCVCVFVCVFVTDSELIFLCCLSTLLEDCRRDYMCYIGYGEIGCTIWEPICRIS